MNSTDRKGGLAVGENHHRQASKRPASCRLSRMLQLERPVSRLEAHHRPRAVEARRIRRDRDKEQDGTALPASSELILRASAQGIHASKC